MEHLLRSSNTFRVDKDANGRISEEEIQEIICLSATANNLSNIQTKAEEYAALIMEELDPDGTGYILIDKLETLLKLGILYIHYQSYQTKCTPPLQRKSDPGSDGAVSSLDSEHACPSSQHANFATDASSGSREVWSTSVLPGQRSPKKALRAAMLKSRFADTILKAQQKTLLE